MLKRTVGFQDTKDFVSGDKTDLRNTVCVTEGDTDLGRSQTLTSKLDDLVDNFLWGGFKPRGGCSTVR